MKVILLQELKGRGGEGDVIDVAKGFAVNFLFPRKIAVEATSGNLKQLEQRGKNIRVRETQRSEDAAKIAEILGSKPVVVEAKVGDEGKLFGSVTSTIIHQAINDTFGLDIDRRQIETHGPIKEVGERVVEVALYREIKANVTVHVVPEGRRKAAVPTVTLEEVEGVDADGSAHVEIAEELAE